MKRSAPPTKSAANIQDRVAKLLLNNHGVVLNNFKKYANEWWVELKNNADAVEHIDYKKCTIVFGKDHRAKLTCNIADEAKLQIIGLQNHVSLSNEEGMLFPYNEPRRVAFHMGTVSFPIDIIFIGDDGRVTKKLENIEPGTKGSWGMPHIIAVVETNGGFCGQHNIEVGTEVFELTDKEAQLDFKIVEYAQDQSGNLLRLTESSDGFKVIGPLGETDLYPYAAEAKTVAQQQLNMNIPLKWYTYRTASIQFYKISTELGFMPAFYDTLEDKIIKSPGFHDIDILGGAWEVDPSRFIDGFVDSNGEFYTREEMHELSKIEKSEELYGIKDILKKDFEEPPFSILSPEEREDIGLGFVSLPPKKSQEVYPRYPRKDLNPKQVPPNVTHDRFKDRDLVDVQVDHQPMDTNYEQFQGYDQGRLQDENDEVAPVRPSP